MCMRILLVNCHDDESSLMIVRAMMYPIMISILTLYMRKDKQTPPSMVGAFCSNHLGGGQFCKVSSVFECFECQLFAKLLKYSAQTKSCLPNESCEGKANFDPNVSLISSINDCWFGSKGN